MCLSVFRLAACLCLRVPASVWVCGCVSWSECLAPNQCPGRATLLLMLVFKGQLIVQTQKHQHTTHTKEQPQELQTNRLRFEAGALLWMFCWPWVMHGASICLFKVDSGERRSVDPGHLQRLACEWLPKLQVSA